MEGYEEIKESPEEEKDNIEEIEVDEGFELEIEGNYQGRLL
jgi:hypothetical protein